MGSHTNADRTAVEEQLWQEFHRLNEIFFDGILELGEIRLSTRKQYGGYYMKAKSLIVVSWAAHITHGWEETMNTFRHEVAHIVHQNHSRAFWEVAEKLGCTRRYALPPVAHAYARYVYECPACRAQIFRRKRLNKSSCGKCDRKFNPDFQFRLVSQAVKKGIS